MDPQGISLFNHEKMHFLQLENLIGQFPFSSPTVFNFFFADYDVPVSDADITAASPEPESEEEEEEEEKVSDEAPVQVVTPELQIPSSGLQCAAAIIMSNIGGAWDNSKKYISAGGLGMEFMKGSEARKNSVTCDTVGDPLKDTSGPALNIDMKLTAIISLIFGSAMAE